MTTGNSSNALTPTLRCAHGGSTPPRDLLLSTRLVFGFDIRRQRAEVRRGAGFINLGFQMSRLLNQDGSKLRVGGGLGELEKRRRLTREIVPAYHGGSPFY